MTIQKVVLIIVSLIAFLVLVMLFFSTGGDIKTAVYNILGSIQKSLFSAPEISP